MIYCFEFPIPNYYGDGIFDKQVFFEGERCPSHSKVVSTLKRLSAETDRIMSDIGIGFDNEYAACLKCIKNIVKGEKLPHVYANLVQTNVFCHTEFGEKPLTVKRIGVIQLCNLANANVAHCIPRKTCHK